MQRLSLCVTRSRRAVTQNGPLGPQTRVTRLTTCRVKSARMREIGYDRVTRMPEQEEFHGYTHRETQGPA